MLSMLYILEPKSNDAQMEIFSYIHLPFLIAAAPMSIAIDQYPSTTSQTPREKK